MNILIPHNWLLQHVATDAAPAEIQRLLSLSGPSVERIYEREGEPVYDIEVTTNRVDMMSVRGIAREAAVILSQAGIRAKLQELNLPALSELKPTTQTLPLPKITNDPTLNTRLVCIVLDSVSQAETPGWMAKRLRQVEMSVHRAAIDITNYITHELGHPCHAFDYDKLMATGGEIIVTTAKAEETFTTLDGQSFTTVGGEVVFKNSAGEIIDLPSIKGTQNTSVDDSTTRVLLLMESIRAEKVRFTSMSHAIRTTAAQLMEKHVDPYLMDSVLSLGVQLYQDLCGAQIASEAYSEWATQPTPTTVTVPLQRFADYLGIELDLKTIVTILETLECRVTPTKTSISVTPPSFRPDIAIPADVIEEVARIYGYHTLPSTVMPTAIPTTRPTTTNFQLESRLKRFLAAIGWQEVYTYSMVSAELAEQSGYATSEHLQLQNPLTEDRVFLRRSLLPSLKEVLITNSHVPALSVFEFAHVYHPQPSGLPNQVLQMGLVTTKNYRELRGSIDAVFSELFLPKPKVIENSSTTGLQQAGILQLESDGSVVTFGEIGILDSARTAAVLDVSLLVAHAHSHPTYQPIPKTAPIFEDYTFTLPESVQIGSVLENIQEAHPLVTAVELTDQYQQNYSFKVTYWDLEHPLSSELVEPARKVVINRVETVHQGALVGSDQVK